MKRLDGIAQLGFGKYQDVGGDGTAVITDAPLVGRFVVPPFNLFDVKTKAWAKRKKEWTEMLGIRGGEGRDAVAHPSGSQALAESQNRIDDFRSKIKVNNICSEKWGRGQKVENASPAKKSTAGTSIFDPVLCEVGYRWFAPPGGRILDPFAGGSTRGLVAAYLGYSYTGIELRPDQILANERQAAELESQFHRWKPNEEWHAPEWIEGTAENLAELLVLHEDYDLIFTCPPYYNLEVYSTDPHDGSAFDTYEEFMVWYENIFRQAVSKLKWNRFAFVTVGDVRNKKSGLGSYHSFEHDQIDVFRKLGLHYYNRATLATAIGSLPVRIDNQFGRYRKLGNTTQSCYTFWKGDDDADAIKEALGTIAAKDGYEGDWK